MGDDEEFKLNRRDLLKSIAYIAGLSMIPLVGIERDLLVRMLKPISVEEVLAYTEDEYPSELEVRAMEVQEELREWYRDKVEELCSDRGVWSSECLDARERYKYLRVKATPANKGKKYAMALDLNRCIGCRRCVYACVMENNIGRNVGIEWIQVLETPRSETPPLELTEATRDYDPSKAPKPDKVYVPIACMHCERPPCVMVCPVRATWKEEDGIVVIDYNRCIGCRYCAVACPYGARHFNWAQPEVPINEINPNMHILGNIPRPVHVIEKCTWCIQRVRDGGIPACVEACPVGARIFGDLKDPKSPVRRVLEEYGGFVLKPEAGTHPKFFYFFGPKRTPPRSVGGEEAHA